MHRNLLKIIVSQMLRTNLFFKFLKSKNYSSTKIIQYNSNESFTVKDQINNEIIDIDKKISENSKALVEAQIVKLRSTFSKSNNLIENIGKNIYKKKLEESIRWHQAKIKELYLRRRELMIKLEKLKGIFWINQIKRFLRIILIVVFVLLSMFIFLSGFVITIYLMPLILSIILIYFLSTKKYQ